MASRPVRTRHQGGAVELLFTRPEKRNALDSEMSAALTEAVLSLDDTSCPLVLRSGTPGMFMAGTDLEELRSRGLDDSLARKNAHLFDLIERYPGPTVALVEGWALGGGCELALACDFRVTHPGALWGLPEVRLGVIPSGGGLQRLEALVGRGQAVDLILTGRRIDGQRAYELGLAQRLAEDLATELAALLSDLAEASPLALRLAKEAMRVKGDEARLVDAAAQAICLASTDTQARIQTFLAR